MRLPDLRPWACLLLADSALLWLLRGAPGGLLPQGLPGLWLEGLLRLGGLWALLRLGGPRASWGASLPPLCLATPLFLSLRALAGGTPSAPPARVAGACWGWLLAGYAAAGLGGAAWAAMGAPGARRGEPGRRRSSALAWRLLRLSRPDLPLLVAAFFFLAAALLGECGRPAGGGRRPRRQRTPGTLLPPSGEMLIPHYFGRVIDILGRDFDPEAFASAMFLMCLLSVGR